MGIDHGARARDWLTYDGADLEGAVVLGEGRAFRVAACIGQHHRGLGPLAGGGVCLPLAVAWPAARHALVTAAAGQELHQGIGQIAPLVEAHVHDQRLAVALTAEGIGDHLLIHGAVHLRQIDISHPTLTQLRHPGAALGDPAIQLQLVFLLQIHGGDVELHRRLAPLGQQCEGQPLIGLVVELGIQRVQVRNLGAIDGQQTGSRCQVCLLFQRAAGQQGDQFNPRLAILPVAAEAGGVVGHSRG